MLLVRYACIHSTNSKSLYIVDWITTFCGSVFVYDFISVVGNQHQPFCSEMEKTSDKNDNFEHYG